MTPPSDSSRTRTVRIEFWYLLRPDTMRPVWPPEMPKTISIPASSSTRATSALAGISSVSIGAIGMALSFLRLYGGGELASSLRRRQCSDGTRESDERSSRRLCNRRGRIGGLRACRSAERGWGAGGSARSGPARLASDDPCAGRRVAPARKPAGQLELLCRARARHRQSRGSLAARPGAGRHQLDQRHAVCARQSGRLRRLGADGLPRLELRRCTVLF